MLTINAVNFINIYVIIIPQKNRIDNDEMIERKIIL